MIIKKCEMCGKEIEAVSPCKKYCYECKMKKKAMTNLASYHRKKNKTEAYMCIDCGRIEVFRCGTRCKQCAAKHKKEYNFTYKEAHKKPRIQNVKHQEKMNEVFNNANHNADAKTFYSNRPKAYNHEKPKAKDSNGMKSLAARIKLLKKVHAAYHKRKDMEERFFLDIDTRYGMDSFW